MTPRTRQLGDRLLVLSVFLVGLAVFLLALVGLAASLGVVPQ